MRALLIGLMVLGLMGIAVVGICGGNEEVDKVVIGVLDLEIIGVTGGSGVIEDPKQLKKALMKELRRNTKIKLVDIRESCSLSDLKKLGFEQAKRYKMNYGLDMILHIKQITIRTQLNYYFSLIDLYTKKIKRVSIELQGHLLGRFRGISNKLLVSGDLNRVLRAKEKALEEKEVAVSRELKEGPKEIEDPLIQKGLTLIAEGGYIRVL